MIRRPTCYSCERKPCQKPHPLLTMVQTNHGYHPESTRWGGKGESIIPEGATNRYAAIRQGDLQASDNGTSTWYLLYCGHPFYASSGNLMRASSAEARTVNVDDTGLGMQLDVLTYYQALRHAGVPAWQICIMTPDDIPPDLKDQSGPSEQQPVANNILNESGHFYNGAFPAQKDQPWGQDLSGVIEDARKEGTALLTREYCAGSTLLHLISRVALIEGDEYDTADDGGFWGVRRCSYGDKVVCSDGVERTVGFTPGAHDTVVVCAVSHGAPSIEFTPAGIEPAPPARSSFSCLRSCSSCFRTDSDKGSYRHVFPGTSADGSLEKCLYRVVNFDCVDSDGFAKLPNPSFTGWVPGGAWAPAGVQYLSDCKSPGYDPHDKPGPDPCALSASGTPGSSGHSLGSLYAVPPSGTMPAWNTFVPQFVTSTDVQYALQRFYFPEPGDVITTKGATYFQLGSCYGGGICDFFDTTSFPKIQPNPDYVRYLTDDRRYMLMPDAEPVDWSLAPLVALSMSRPDHTAAASPPTDFTYPPEGPSAQELTFFQWPKTGPTILSSTAPKSNHRMLSVNAQLGSILLTTLGFYGYDENGGSMPVPSGAPDLKDAMTVDDLASLFAFYIAQLYNVPAGGGMSAYVSGNTAMSRRPMIPWKWPDAS